jgi:hypothetical protein
VVRGVHWRCLTGIVWSAIIRVASKTKVMGAIIAMIFMSSLLIDGLYSALVPIYSLIRVFWLSYLPIIALHSTLAAIGRFTSARNLNRIRVEIRHRSRPNGCPSCRARVDAVLTSSGSGHKRTYSYSMRTGLLFTNPVLERRNPVPGGFLFRADDQACPYISTRSCWWPGGGGRLSWTRPCPRWKTSG